MFNSIKINFIDTTSEEYSNFQKAKNAWPHEVKSFDQIPNSYKDIFPSYTGSFPYTIVIPDENYLFFRKKGFLITTIGDKLHILDKLGSVTGAVSFDKQTILYIVSGTALLYSWITIAGENKVYTFNFHSVMEYLFLPIIDQFRDIEQSFIGEVENEKKYLLYESNDPQLKANIKFRNLMRNHFIKGTKIKNIIFQPGYLFDFKQFPILNLKLFKRYISNHLILLTDQEIIFIQESKIIQKKMRKSYDYNYTFINKKNIERCEIKYEQENTLRNLIITLKNGTRLSAYFSIENKYFDSFISEFKHTINKA